MSKIEKDIKKHHRVVTFAWDSDFEERINGRLLSVSSPGFTVTTIDKRSSKIKLISNHPDEPDKEIL